MTENKISFHDKINKLNKITWVYVSSDLDSETLPLNGNS